MVSEDTEIQRSTVSNDGMNRMSVDDAVTHIEQALRECESYDNADNETSSADVKALSWLVTGAPRSGKTTVAEHLALAAFDVWGSSAVTLVQANRLLAQEINARILRQMKVSAQPRVATTLSAVAYRIIEQRQRLTGKPAPKLLDAAEQEALLRAVLDQHIEHARTGDMCDTCHVIRQYFVGDARKKQHDSVTSESSTLDIFECCITRQFISQLRDMFARMNECGASHTIEDKILGVVSSSPDLNGAIDTFSVEHMRVQLGLSFTLRYEYALEVQKTYPQEFRLDSSRLLREAALTVENMAECQVDGIQIPRCLIVDDVQDLTLAGIHLVHAMYKQGTHVVLIGNPDETVQGFRGGQAEYIWRNATYSQRDNNGFLGEDFACFNAQELALTPSSQLDGLNFNYKDKVAARVALNIPREYQTDLSLIVRPEKFPTGLTNVSQVQELDLELSQDGSVKAGLFHRVDEEKDYVMRQLMTYRIDKRVAWNDCVVIAHDNATARQYGRMLEHSGIPVRYSAVTKPLSQEGVAIGLCAYLELGLCSHAVAQFNAAPYDILASDIYRNFAQLCTSPFGLDKSFTPISSAHVLRQLDTIAFMLRAYSNRGDDDTESFEFKHIGSAWKSLRADVVDAVQGYASQDDARAALWDDCDGRALLTLMVTDIDGVQADILHVLRELSGKFDPMHMHVEHMMNVISAVAQTLPQSDGSAVGGHHDIFDSLWAAWDGADVSNSWQKAALDYDHNDKRLQTNEWLDGAMRFFDYASSVRSGMSVSEFIAHVRGLDVRVDSLAQVGPVEDAVTVTTPASCTGKQWKYVWMPSVQQSVWPNLATRHTIFGTDDLTHIMMTGSWKRDTRQDMRFLLHEEKRSFLTSVTRSSDALHISAVWNHENSPSDFLFTYLPEFYDRALTMDEAVFTDVPIVGGVSAVDSQDVQSQEFEVYTMRDIVVQARVILARELGVGDINLDHLSPQALDAIETLRYLHEQGYDCALPSHWSFVYADMDEDEEDETVCDETITVEFGHGDTEDGRDKTDTDKTDIRKRDIDKTAADKKKIVPLSPSSVESIWGCPICFLMEREFSGPRASSQAQSFGTLFHEVCQWASQDEHMDFLVRDSDMTPTACVEQIASRMVDKYRSIAVAPSASASMDDMLVYRKNMQLAEQVCANVAQYFVDLHASTFAINEKFHPLISPLTNVECEKKFDAYITVDDIVYFYNAIPDRATLSRQEFIDVMDVLVGGMPEGFSDDMVVNLHGIIDRVETRTDSSTGEDVTVVIDYKTTKNEHVLKQQVTNLQLVCYQLGLLFDTSRDESNTAHRADKVRARLAASSPEVIMSVLFDVRHEASPGVSRNEPFAKYQQSLITRGHLASGEHGLRNYSKDFSKLWDGTQLPHDLEELREIFPRLSDAAFDRVSQEIVNESRDATMWALSMIARVFYAAAVLESESIDVREVHKNQHQYCSFASSCPACAQHDSSVMEEWL